MAVSVADLRDDLRAVCAQYSVEPALRLMAALDELADLRAQRRLDGERYAALREVAYALMAREHCRDHEALPAFEDCRFAPCPEYRVVLAACDGEP